MAHLYLRHILCSNQCGLYMQTAIPLIHSCSNVVGKQSCYGIHTTSLKKKKYTSLHSLTNKFLTGRMTESK